MILLLHHVWKTNVELAKKFICIFLTSSGKSWINFLANPIYLPFPEYSKNFKDLSQLFSSWILSDFLSRWSMDSLSSFAKVQGGLPVQHVDKGKGAFPCLSLGRLWVPLGASSYFVMKFSSLGREVWRTSHSLFCTLILTCREAGGWAEETWTQEEG